MLLLEENSREDIKAGVTYLSLVTGLIQPIKPYWNERNTLM
jgi:hypothetical protein